MAHARALGEAQGSQELIGGPQAARGRMPEQQQTGSGELTTVTFSFCFTWRAKSLVLASLQLGFSVFFSVRVLARPLWPLLLRHNARGGNARDARANT